jgi:DNA-binding NarL/FixJ family response regulator
MHSDVSYASGAFDAGASGFVLKQRAVVDLIPAIRAVCQGRRYVSEEPSSTPEP